MKRDEMIDVMLKADEENSPSRSLWNCMSHVLVAMEEAGMKPPSTPDRYEIITAVMEGDCPSCMHAKWDELK